MFRIIIAGDFNQTKKAWLASSLFHNQIVNIPTYSSGSTLNLILTNTEDLYHPPTSLGPVDLYDHYPLFLKAKSSVRKPKLSRITIRPITDSVIREYSHWIAEYDFPEVSTDVSLIYQCFASGTFPRSWKKDVERRERAHSNGNSKF